MRTAERIFILAAESPRTRPPEPCVVSVIRVSIAKPEKCLAANFGRREHRIERGHEVTSGGLEIGIEWHRLDFCSPDFVINEIVPDLLVLDFVLFLFAFLEAPVT